MYPKRRDTMPSEKKSFYKSLSNLALLSQIGFSMVVPIIGCVWVANFLMKKFILLLMTITIVSLVSDINCEKTIIPKEAIRFRVIANSNSQEDQNLKVKVKDNLEKDISNVLKNKTTLTSSRTALENNLLLFEKNINNTLKKENSQTTFRINYGMNYFPEKEYKNVIYKEGNYESLVVTLGDGLGENFWCVLFPPLCLLEGEEENAKDVEYHILVKDILKKYEKNTNKTK